MNKSYNIFSIILGLVFGFIIMKLKNNNNFHGPNSNIIRQNVYQYGNKYGNKCYTYTPEVYMCGTDVK
jgi:hypothetical protein